MARLGATTVEEYRKYVEKDKALERRFQPVSVPEPTVEESVQILRGIARKYEAHHRIRYSEESLQSCVKFASQYIQVGFGRRGGLVWPVSRCVSGGRWVAERWLGRTVTCRTRRSTCWMRRVPGCSSGSWPRCRKRPWTSGRS